MPAEALAACIFMLVYFGSFAALLGWATWYSSGKTEAHKAWRAAGDGDTRRRDSLTVA